MYITSYTAIERMKDMDWENEAILLFDELLKPIPVFVRPMVKKGIKNKIVEVALEEQASNVNQDHVIHGFILAAPPGSAERLKKLLDGKKIDYSKYASLFEGKM